MKLEDAIATGRPFKRAGHCTWISPQTDGSITIRQEDLLADDWVIKPAPLELEIYISPDKTRISLQPDDDYTWEKKRMIEKMDYE